LSLQCYPTQWNIFVRLLLNINSMTINTMQRLVRAEKYVNFWVVFQCHFCSSITTCLLFIRRNSLLINGRPICNKPKVYNSPLCVNQFCNSLKNILSCVSYVKNMWKSEALSCYHCFNPISLKVFSVNGKWLK